MCAIWRRAQQVIRAEGTSVVFGGRGKHPKMTLHTNDLLLHSVVRDAVGVGN